MLRAVLHFAQGEGDGLQLRGRGNNAFQILQAGHIAGQGGGKEFHGREGVHQLIVRGVSGFIGGIDGLGTHNEIGQRVHAGAERFLRVQVLFQAFLRRK